MNGRRRKEVLGGRSRVGRVIGGGGARIGGGGQVVRGVVEGGGGGVAMKGWWSDSSRNDSGCGALVPPLRTVVLVWLD